MRGHGERADAGSTLVSSLVTVLVLTLVVATGAGFLRQTGRVALRLQEQALFSVQAARLEDTLINALARVAQPRSLPEPALRSAPGLLELPWFGGEEGQTLRLSWNADGVTVTTPQSAERFPLVAVRDLELVADPVWHARIELSSHSGRQAPRSLVIPVGQLPRP